jgi:hypothetical protein
VLRSDESGADNPKSAIANQQSNGRGVARTTSCLRTAVIAGSNPAAHTNAGRWCNGNIAVSKTAVAGSNPARPASDAHFYSRIQQHSEQGAPPNSLAARRIRKGKPMGDGPRSEAGRAQALRVRLPLLPHCCEVAQLVGHATVNRARCGFKSLPRSHCRIAQADRAPLCEGGGSQCKSGCGDHICRYRRSGMQAPPSEGGDRGSSPRSDANTPR